MRLKACRSIRPDWQRVERYLDSSFREGKLSNGGPCVRLLQERLTTYFKCIDETEKQVLVVSSGHTALMAAYHALGVQRPLMPAYTFPSTSVAAELQGITPLFSDVNPDSGCLELENIKAINRDSYDSIVLVCALSSIPLTLPEIQDFCNRYDKKLVIDAAGAFGTDTVAGYGDACCYSMHATKALPAGEGGIVIIRKDRASTVERYINFGMDSTKTVVSPGLNGKLSEYAAAVALTLLERIDFYLEARKKNYKKLWESWTKANGPVTYRILSSLRGLDTVPQFGALQFDQAEQAKRFQQKLTEVGIESLKYYKPLAKNCPVSEELYQTNVCVPIHQTVTDQDLDLIIKLAKKS